MLKKRTRFQVEIETFFRNRVAYGEDMGFTLKIFICHYSTIYLRLLPLLLLPPDLEPLDLEALDLELEPLLGLLYDDLDEDPLLGEL